MNNSYIETPPEYTAMPYQLNEYHPAMRVMDKARQANLRRIRAQDYVLNSEYNLPPFQQQMILDDARYRRQLMLQREREDARRRRMAEQSAYNVLGSTASTAGKYFVSSLFQ